jgi:hypothetical protein
METCHYSRPSYPSALGMVTAPSPPANRDSLEK